jgi:hypothetical protein
MSSVPWIKLPVPPALANLAFEMQPLLSNEQLAGIFRDVPAHVQLEAANKRFLKCCCLQLQAC